MTIRIDRVVTRGGDRGQTSLGDGTRVSKTDIRIEAMGVVDELNAQIGVLEQLCHESGDYAADCDVLRQIQGGLFDLGADLCMPQEEGSTRAPVLVEQSIQWLESIITELGKELPSLTSFVLPGGSRVAAQAHVVRTVARRAERRVIAVTPTLSVAICFLNRLSDYFFQLARKANENGKADVLWQPRQWS